MFQLLYRSIATYPEFDASDLAILREALAFNAPADVSGYLMRADMQFVQVLCGEETVVRALFEKVARDPRHHAVEILLAETVEGDNPFEGWSMGYDMVAAHVLGLDLAGEDTRPAVSEAQARKIVAELAKSAKSSREFGSAFPYARNPSESEAEYLKRLGAAG